MITLLVGLLVAAVVIYIVYIILGMINLPAPIKTIVYLILALIIIFYLLNYFGLYTLPR